MRAIRILTFTTLYPNHIQPRHGVFVEQRLRKIHSLGEIECRVMAPVPWFPFRSKRFGRYAEFAKVQATEDRFGIRVDHPSYPVVPRIGMTAAPLLLAAFAYPALSRLISDGYDFDLIDAHYFYPDGVAATLLARWLKKPVVITARGSDISLIPRYSLPRKMILWAARKADQNFTVCQALKDELTRLGAEADRITVFRNGVDLDFFRPFDYRSIREKLGLSRRVLLSVGYLIELKGHHLVIEALQFLPDFELLIAGDGEESGHLKQLAQSLGVADRVYFLGNLSQAELLEYYSAADTLVLASSREGWANVLLESMACGTPVVATSVGGTPEVVTSPAAGILIKERTAEAIAEGVRRLIENPPGREETRRYAENYSWDITARGIRSTFLRILEKWKRP
jgi:teichuronic acid biosynthesis glycosyltransferase TuaC